MSREIEWRGRTDFAEVAEAIGISTKLVFAANVVGSRIWVIYSPDYPEQETFWSIWLARGQDGVLRKDSVPREMPGMWEKLEETMKEALYE